jgi:hypothetical protein
MSKKRTVAAILGLFALGCGTSMTGESGNLSLDYDHGGLFEQVDRPIGVGLMADVVITDVESDERADLSSANSSDPGVLEVTAVDGGLLRLLGGSAGSASLSVITTDGIEDSFTLQVDVVDRVVFGDPVFDREDDAPYVLAAGASILLQRIAYTDGGEPLTGYGLPMPMVEPPGAAEGLEDDTHYGMLVQFLEPGAVQVSSGSDATTYTVVDAASVTWTVDDLDDIPGLSDPAPLNLTLSGVSSDGTHALGSLSSLDEAACTIEPFFGQVDTYWIVPETGVACTIILNNDPSNVVATYTYE